MTEQRLYSMAEVVEATGLTPRQLRCRADSTWGDPLIPDWYNEPGKTNTGGASNKLDMVISWWSRWRNADIAAVPHKSDHFVIVAIESEGGYEGLEALRPELPKLDFQHSAPWGEWHLWFKTKAPVQTSHHRLG
jgi:hypothetical protein